MVDFRAVYKGSHDRCLVNVLLLVNIQASYVTHVTSCNITPLPFDSHMSYTREFVAHTWEVDGLKNQIQRNRPETSPAAGTNC